MVLALVDPQADNGGPLGMLAVLGAGPLGWEVVYQSGLAADVDLLALNDVNDDGQPDVVWSDTTCGAQRLFHHRPRLLLRRWRLSLLDQRQHHPGVGLASAWKM